MAGTGLGLAIAKSVAEAHEGFVDIVDTPGWSTTFRAFLPLRQAVNPAAGAGAGVSGDAQPTLRPSNHPAATSMPVF